MDLAHLSTNALYGLPFTEFTVSHSIGSVSIPTAVPLPLMTGSSESSPTSPNTKPEPRYHQCCCYTNAGLSGSRCSSAPLPMPHRRRLSANYVVKSSKIIWNSHARNLNAFYRILLILPLILTISCGLQWNEKNKLKFTQIWIMDLAHLSTNPLCSLPFTHFTISPSTSSVWIHIVLPPLMTDFSGSSPSSPNTKPEPRYHQCCCDAKPGLSGSSCASVLLPMPHRRQISAKYVVKSSKILLKFTSKKSQRLLPHSSHTSSDNSHIMWSAMKWKEQAQIHLDLHDGLGTSQHSV